MGLFSCCGMSSQVVACWSFPRLPCLHLLWWETHGDQRKSAWLSWDGSRLLYQRQVTISQIKYTKKMIDKFPEPITYSAATPATDYLFTILNPNEAKPLDASRKTAHVHTIVRAFSSANMLVTTFKIKMQWHSYQREWGILMKMIGENSRGSFNTYMGPTFETYSWDKQYVGH